MPDQSRIISLIASATEIVCALGMQGNLVGRSHECDFPPDVRALPQCTEPKFSPDGTSYEIDQKVRAILQESLSVYRVHAEILEELQPTHIITQSQCEVCAVSLKDVEAAACELISSQPQIISLEPYVLPDVWNDIRVVATALGIAERGEKLIARLQERLQYLRAVTHNAAEKDGPVSLTFVEWIQPLMQGGNWMPELIDIAGAEQVALDEEPDVVVVAPCGFDIARALQDMKDLPAHEGKRVYVADGNQFFNRPGPRLVESAEILAEICYPDSVHFGHEKTGWIPYARP